LERDVARLDSNEGQFGPMAAAAEAVSRLTPELNRYPCRPLPLIERLAERHGIPVDWILPGNGADAIVGYLCTAFLQPGDEAVLPWPSFVTYRLDTVRTGATPVLVPLRAGACDLPAMAGRIGPRTRLAFVCNPNNPTGGVVTREELRAFLDTVPASVLVVIDEAYHEYVDTPEYPDAIAEHVRERPNVAVLRTFSKLFGLAGLRVGYLVAAPDVIAAAGRCRHWFDVSEPAHVAAAASLDDAAEVQRRREVNRTAVDELTAVVRAAGFDPMPSAGNFVCFAAPDADGVAAALAGQGVFVRELTGFGAPGHLRVTAGSPADHRLLADALAAVAP
jgi:histidinol-phosphate aminotransferase